MAAKTIDVTLVCDTSILADGDVICATAEIPNVVIDSGGSALLESFTLRDEDDQGVALDIVFMRSNVSLGTVNGAPNITDANAREIIGRVSIATTDFIDIGASKTAQIAASHSNMPLMVNALTGTSIYIGAISRGGTPTYTASGLKLSLSFIQS